MTLIMDTEERWVIVKTVMLFFTVYSIHFTFLPTTPRIITLFLVLLVYLQKRKHKLEKEDIHFLVQTTIICLYSFMIEKLMRSASTGAATILSYTTNFLIFVGIFPIISVVFFKDEKEFCKCLFYANSVQSLIVISSAFIPTIREYLQNIQTIDFSRYNYRIVGLGIAGSGGSVYLFCGLLAGTYLIQKKNNSFGFVFFYVINFFAIILVGRTGFYCACIMVIYSVITMLKKKNIQGVKFLIGIILISALFFFLSIYISALFNTNTTVLKYTFSRLNEIFREDSALNGLSRMNKNFPNLGLDFIFGTGVVRGYTIEGIRIWHDGGYAQRLASLGIIMFLFSYGSFYLYLWNKIKKIKEINNDIFWMLVISLVLMIIIEYKEPFIYMLAFPYTLLMLAKLSLRNNSF